MTRIDPRHIQRYRAQANYTPRPWLNVGANLNILEEENHTGDINYDMHNRTFGVNGVIAPKEVISLDFDYNFSAFQQSNNICLIGTVVPAGSFPCNNDPTLLETELQQSHKLWGVQLGVEAGEAAGCAGGLRQHECGAFSPRYLRYVNDLLADSG